MQLAAVALRNLLRHGQPNAVARLLPAVPGPVERLRDPCQLGGLDADAGIGHGYGHRGRVAVAQYHHHITARVFAGIIQQVEQGVGEQLRVAGHRKRGVEPVRHLAESQLQRPAGVAGLALGQGLGEALVQAHGFAAEAGFVGLGQGQQAVGQGHEVAQIFHGGSHAVLGLRQILVVGVAGLQRAQGGGQRRSQFVGSVTHEAFLRLKRLLHAAQHPVESDGQLCNFVGAVAFVHASAQVAGRDSLHLLHHPRNGLERFVGEIPARQNDEHQRPHVAGQQYQAQAGQLRPAQLVVAGRKQPVGPASRPVSQRHGFQRPGQKVHRHPASRRLQRELAQVFRLRHGVVAHVKQAVVGRVDADFFLLDGQQVAPSKGPCRRRVRIGRTGRRAQVQAGRHDGLAGEPVAEALLPGRGVEVIHEGRKAELNGQHQQGKAQDEFIANQHRFGLILRA